jgi:tetratricopeptide (TPR) repeat protein
MLTFKIHGMKTLSIISILIITTILPGCNKFLDEQPVSEISTDNFWKNANDLNTGMAGVYDGIQNMFSNNFVFWGDARTDNFRIGGNGRRDYPYNELTSTSTGSDWAPIYTAIGRINTAIKYIPNIPNVEAKVLNNKLAQCYAMRAYCYFWLVRLWGDVPVWKEPYEDLAESPYREKTPVNTIFAETIIPDLEMALQLVDVTNTNVFQVTIGGMYAMLTEVYMWQKNYDKVLEYADKLTALNRYSLIATANWKLLFTDPSNTTNKESIWSLNWNWKEDGGAGISEQIGAGNTGSDFSAEDKLWNYWLVNTTDVRGKQTFDYNVTNRDKFLKFYPVTLGSNGNQLYPNEDQAEVKFPLYRLADILLLRAEAHNKKSNPAGAITLLNQVRKRANPALVDFTPADFASEKALEDTILFERQLELVLEAKRWFDLVRTNKVIEVMDPILSQRQTISGTPPVGFGDPRKILWPIHRNNLNANPLIRQNPPYAD